MMIYLVYFVLIFSSAMVFWPALEAAGKGLRDIKPVDSFSDFRDFGMRILTVVTVILATIAPVMLGFIVFERYIGKPDAGYNAFYFVASALIAVQLARLSRQYWQAKRQGSDQ